MSLIEVGGLDSSECDCVLIVFKSVASKVAVKVIFGCNLI